MLWALICMVNWLYIRVTCAFRDMINVNFTVMVNVVSISICFSIRSNWELNIYHRSRGEGWNGILLFYCFIATTEASLRPSQTSMMELSAKIVQNAWSSSAKSIRFYHKYLRVSWIRLWNINQLKQSFADVLGNRCFLQIPQYSQKSTCARVYS